MRPERLASGVRCLTGTGAAVCLAYAIVAAWGALAPIPLAAQTPLERTPLLSGGWVAQPWTLHVDPAFRFDRREDGLIRQRGTFALELGLPHWLLVGARFAPQSPLAARRPNEWEVYGRWAMARPPGAAPFDLAVQAGFNDAARSVDGEVTAGYWVGPVRLIGAGRVLTNAWAEDRPRVVLGGGVVAFPSPRGLPVSLAADLGSPIDRMRGERVAWSAGLNLGVPYTTHTLSLFATNTGTGTLQGVTRGVRRTRLAVAVTAPIPAGRILGRVVPRQRAMEAVEEGVAPAPGEVRSAAFRHAFTETRIVVRRGATVAWTNRDAVVHTVTADDGAWNSGAIQPGETWRARFDEPGIYPYHCGPHPYMKGVVVVR